MSTVDFNSVILIKTRIFGLAVCKGESSAGVLFDFNLG